MKILVTGGAGYVGYSVVRSLLANSSLEHITVYDNLSRRQFALLMGRAADDRVRFVEADILDGRTLERELQGVDAVVHLAATVHLPETDAEAHSFDQVNNWGSAQVAAVIEDQPSVRHAVYMSTAVVYGSSDQPITTDTPPRPNTFYGVTKLRGEAHFTRLATPERRVHVIRAGNVFGINPAARFDTVVNRFLLDGRFARRLRILGSGQQTRAFIDVHRLADTVSALVASDLPSSTLNAVDTSCSINDLAEIVRGIDPGIEMLHVDQDMRMQQVDVVPSADFEALVGPPAEDLSEAVRAAWTQLGI